MTMKRWDGAAYQDIAAAKRWDGAAYIDLTVAKRWDGVAWQDMILPGGSGDLTAIAEPAGAGRAYFQSEPAPSFVTLTSVGSITVTPVGGAGSPTFAWTKLAGDSAILCLSPTAATTFFRTTIGSGLEYNAIWRCTVTDGPETAFVDVDITFSYETSA